MSMLRAPEFRPVTGILALLMLAATRAACGSRGTPDTNTAAGEGGATVTLTVDPNPPVTNQEAKLTIQVRDASGQGVLGAKVEVVAEHTGMNMGKLTGVGTGVGGGTYTTTITPTMAGTWKVRVAVDVNGKTQQATFELQVK
jgi:hypothetical protein